MFQHKPFFSLVKDLFNLFEGLRRSVNIGLESESEWIFDLAGLQKKLSIRCQISSSENTYLVFQHKSFFSLVKDLFNLFEGLRRSVNIGLESESEWIFDLAGLQKKLSIRCQISSSENTYLVFQHKSFFSLVKDLFNLFEGLRRSVNIGIEYDSEWFFGLAVLQKKLSIRC